MKVFTMFTVVYKSIVTGFTQLYDVVARKQQYQYGAMMLYTIMSLSSFKIYIFMLLLMLLDLQMIMMITAPTTKILIILGYFEKKCCGWIVFHFTKGSNWSSEKLNLTELSILLYWLRLTPQCIFLNPWILSTLKRNTSLNWFLFKRCFWSVCEK